MFVQRLVIGANSLSKYGTIVFGEVGGAGLSPLCPHLHCNKRSAAQVSDTSPNENHICPQGATQEEAKLWEVGGAGWS